MSEAEPPPLAGCSCREEEGAGCGGSGTFVTAIVPAAGLSTRYGGPNKLLQPWGDTTIVGQVARTLAGCGLPVIVVTGRDAQAVAQATEPAQAVFNPEFDQGLGTSIACGVRAATPESGYLIALGDMPELQARVVKALIGAFNTASHDAILAPVYDAEPDRPGHPVLFGPAHRQALEALQGDEGARSIVQANQDKLIRVPVEGRLEDIDEKVNG